MQFVKNVEDWLIESLDVERWHALVNICFVMFVGDNLKDINYTNNVHLSNNGERMLYCNNLKLIQNKK